MANPGVDPPDPTLVASARTLITHSLIKSLSPMLRRVARRRVPAHQVEDVVQETWLSAWRSASGYQGRCSLSSWLVAILKRRIADSYRLVQPGDALHENALPADGALAPERIQQAQLVERIAQGLAGLSELERAAVRLCDFEESGRTEAASSLGVAPGHLRVMLHRAHHKLANELRRLESPPRKKLGRAPCRRTAC